jgi:hypothetical protein
MSQFDLTENSSRGGDYSSTGEDLAKGSGYMLWTAVVAFILLSIGIWIFLLIVHRPPIAAGEIQQVWSHAVHTLNTPVDANGVQTPGEVFDQVLVFAQVRVRNQSEQPIILREMMSNLTLEDGTRSSYAAGPVDYDRIFIAYPELSGLRSKTLLRETVIAPGAVQDGMIVSAFHISPADWAARKKLDFTLQFKHHPDLILEPKGPVTEE